MNIDFLVVLLNIFLIELEKININQYQKLHPYLFFRDIWESEAGSFCHNVIT